MNITKELKNPNGSSMNNPKIDKGNINRVFIITTMRLLFFYCLNTILVNHKEMSFDSIKILMLHRKLLYLLSQSIDKVPHFCAGFFWYIQKYQVKTGVSIYNDS